MNQLIDSVLAQEGVKVDLLVRDDGSGDKTTATLDALQLQGRLSWYGGRNLKPAKSFMQLLRDSHEADFYAFADEDDYWQPDKLSTATKALEPYGNQPALYFSKTQLTDADLNPIPSPPLHPLLTFGESLVYEFVPGCTMVFNHRLRDIINLYSPSYIPMHDVWIYSTALAVGARVVFDPVPHILYRQHGDNTIGQGQGEWHEMRRRLARFTSKEHSRYRRACEISNGYLGMIPEDNRSVLSAFVAAKASLKARLDLVRDQRFVCGNAKTYKLFRLAVLLNTY